MAAAAAVRRREEAGKPKPSRLVVNQAVLAERNPGRVAAVGAWIEPGDPGADGRSWVPADQIEEQLIRHQREKEQRLIRFQGEVKRRVNQHAKQCKRHQIQKSCDALAREGVIVRQSSDAAMYLTPKRNTCTYRNTQVAIYSPQKHWVTAQKISDDSEDDLQGRVETGNKVFFQHAKALKNTMRQVRGRLAALKTVEAEELTLPGGIWKVSPTRDNPVSRRSPVLHRMEAEDEAIPLRGHHDLPAELLTHKSHGQLEKENLMSGKHVCNRLMKEPHATGLTPAYNTDYRAALVLRPGVDEEEERKQRQNQYLMYRRLFMDIEREQVKETRRQKEHERKISKIKRERETERLMEEQRLRFSAIPRVQRWKCELEESQKENINEDQKEKTPKAKQSNRYIEALRAQMKDKLMLHSVALPPLCCCGSDFWDSHPDTCANNCIFYKNPKAYARALQSVLLSRDMWDGPAGSGFSACNISLADPRAVR